MSITLERWRIPALCLLASIALHWLALDALLRTPSEFHLTAPAARLNIAMPLHGVGVAMTGAGATDARPSVAEPGASSPAGTPSQPGASRPADAPSPPVARARDPAIGQSPLPASGAGERSSVAPAAPSLRPASTLEPGPPSIRSGTPAHSAPAQSSGDRGERRGATSSPDALARAGESAPGTIKAASPVDDRGIQTAEQYRVALLFEAGRLRSTLSPSAIASTGRSRLQLDFAAGGALQSTRITASSGDLALDQAATDLLTRAQARVPVPPSLTQRAFSVEATVSFEPR